MSYATRKAATSIVKRGMPIMDKIARDTQVDEGIGISAKAVDYCVRHKYKHVLIITGESARKRGFLDDILAALAEKNISYAIYDGVKPDPTHEQVLAARKAGLTCGAECVIALGGGSVLDCAKIACVGIRNPEMSKRKLMGFKTSRGIKTTPLITIPTTAGTGAEITIASVLTNERGVKHSAGGPHVKPVYCILDASFTLHAPRELTAITAIDALSHGLEALMSPVKQSKRELEERMECVRLVFENLPVVLQEGEFPEERLNLCRAAHLGGHAINKCSCGYAHSIAHVLGATYHIPHGAAISMSLPVVARFNKEISAENLAKTAVYCGFADAGQAQSEQVEALLQKLDELIALCNITDYRDKINKKDLPKLVKKVFKDARVMTPPQTMTKAECLQALRDATS